jgi:hypothetical protein
MNRGNRYYLILLYIVLFSLAQRRGDAEEINNLVFLCVPAPLRAIFVNRSVS